MRDNNNNFFNKFLISLVVYYLIQSRVPPILSTSILVLFTMASLYNTSLWGSIKRKLALSTSLPSSERVELISTLKQLNMYEKRARSWNRQRKVSLRTLSWQQQNWLDQIGYNSKIDKLDHAIRANYKLINEIIAYTKLKNNITYTDMPISTVADTTRDNNNYRVIEALCHYQRDWSPLGDVEILPILQYIKSQTSKMDKLRTMVVNPGSGLGRVAHELALEGFGKVQSIEFSMLMKIMNEFIYAPYAEYPVYPFIHGYSNQVNTTTQLRNFKLETLGRKPLNLDITYGDFNKFEIVPDEFDNVVIVTVFFIDTLENLFEYLESIDKLCRGFKGSKTWINVGPLKYGTRPKIELNLQELLKLVKLMGWDVVDQQDPQLLGYLTDLQSMWQGQYGVSKFTCIKK